MDFCETCQSLIVDLPHQGCWQPVLQIGNSIQRSHEGIGDKNPEGRAKSHQNNSQRADLSPIHRTGNMNLAGIQNFYKLMTFPSF